MAARDESEGESKSEGASAAEERAPSEEERQNPGGEGAPPKVDSDGGSPRDVPSEAGQNLGILFIAAAIGLAILLTIVGLLAVAAMSRALPAPGEPRLVAMAPAPAAIPVRSRPA